MKMQNGDAVIYDEANNLLAVYDNHGRPKEMYCPSDNKATFDRLEAENQ